MSLQLHQFDVRAVPDKQLNQLARLAQRFVETNPDELTTEYLLKGLLTEKLQVWVALEGDEIILALFAELCHFEATQKSFVRVLGIGGDNLDDALRFLPKIEEAYAAQGAELSRFVGRKGWERVLKPHGYVQHSVVYSKALAAPSSLKGECNG